MGSLTTEPVEEERHLKESVLSQKFAVLPGARATRLMQLHAQYTRARTAGASDAKHLREIWVRHFRMAIGDAQTIEALEQLSELSIPDDLKEKLERNLAQLKRVEQRQWSKDIRRDSAQTTRTNNDYADALPA